MNFFRSRNRRNEKFLWLRLAFLSLVILVAGSFFAWSVMYLISNRNNPENRQETGNTANVEPTITDEEIQAEFDRNETLEQQFENSGFETKADFIQTYKENKNVIEELKNRASSTDTTISAESQKKLEENKKIIEILKNR